jgi:hypothetical protein
MKTYCTRLLILSFCILLLSTSCGTYVYKSVTPKTPLLSKKNDFVGQLNLGGAGGEVYAAYAPVNYLGASFSYAGNANSKDSNNAAITKFNDYEFSLIPFYTYEKTLFEMPIGVGLTNKKSTGLSYSPYMRQFIQPTVGFRWPYFEMALLVRISRIDYDNARWGVDTRYEPGVMLRGGSERIKAMLQMRLNYGSNYSRTSEANLHPVDQVLYFPFHTSLGINVYFNFAKKKQTLEK